MFETKTFTGDGDREWLKRAAFVLAVIVLAMLVFAAFGGPLIDTALIRCDCQMRSTGTSLEQHLKLAYGWIIGGLN